VNAGTDGAAPFGGGDCPVASSILSGRTILPKDGAGDLLYAQSPLNARMATARSGQTAPGASLPISSRWRQRHGWTVAATVPRGLFSFPALSPYQNTGRKIFSCQSLGPCCNQRFTDAR
jgi:hypothetical protein